jgi:hypothetical protein
VEKIRFVKTKVPYLSVIGIAGPGDPLANEETFRTLELVGKEFPELTLCLSTNGLRLPENVDRLKRLGVKFITVTMNARELWHFFELRCCNRAQWELRSVADEMLSQVKQVSPHIFAEAGPACVRGPCPEGKMTCGKPRRQELKNLK